MEAWRGQAICPMPEPTGRDREMGLRAALPLCPGGPENLEVGLPRALISLLYDYDGWCCSKEIRFHPSFAFGCHHRISFLQKRVQPERLC